MPWRNGGRGDFFILSGCGIFLGSPAQCRSGPMPNSESVFLRDTQLAERFNVQRQTIWRWVAQGDFPKPVKLSPRCTRWRLSSVLEFERRRGGAA